MSERHTISEFEGSQFRDLTEGFACPNQVGSNRCDQLVRFSRFEDGDGEAECPRCGATLRLEVVVDGSRNPTE